MPKNRLFIESERMMKTITGHMVVKNEERWVWFSIMSVIDYLDKLIIFDNGSTDNTINIIKSILANDKYRNKILFEEKGETDKGGFTKLRQEQLDLTDTDYFMLVDGDEIWWKDSVEEIKNIINSPNAPLLIATRFINCAGDIYHYRKDCRETYHINDVVGAISIRVFSKSIEGIHCSGDYGNEGYVDYSGHTVQNNIWSTVIQNGKFLHTSYLQRAGNKIQDRAVFSRSWKNKSQNIWDCRFPRNYKYPEVLYLQYPEMIHSPWDKASLLVRLMQVKKTVRYLKRKINSFLYNSKCRK